MNRKSIGLNAYDHREASFYSGGDFVFICTYGTMMVKMVYIDAPKASLLLGRRSGLSLVSSYFCGGFSMEKVAVFVDAGYFWVQVSRTLFGEKKPRQCISLDCQRLSISILQKIKDCFPSKELLRIYWYDGPDHNGEKTDSHSRIEELDSFKLRMGSLNFSGQQKAVDGLLIADLIGLAQNKAISDAVIVSGDADLIPGVVTAQALGIRVARVDITDKNATSKYFSCEVDKNFLWREEEVRSFAAPYVSKITEKVDLSSQVEGLNLGEVANCFIQSLGPGTLEKISALREREPIPRELDKRLLERARVANDGVFLSPDESKTLRGLVKKIIAEKVS